jgi:transcriptional regulator GlxA family with amidase domain
MNRSTKPTPTTPTSTTPTTKQRRVVILVFDRAQMLDVAGPGDVFALVERFDPKLRYEVLCVSAKGGPVALSNGLSLMTQSISQVRMAGVDTLVVAGGDKDGLLSALSDEKLGEWVRKSARTVRRLVSVCVGSFALAHWGLLEGRRATSHWSVVDLMQRRFPNVMVEQSALYVQDGGVWTSGGVTTGIDMSLAMVEADSSRLVAGQVAGLLVMAARRVGNQSQYSVQLRAQTGRYAQLVDWISANLRQPLDIASLAMRAGESERSFCRRFNAEVGEPPARFVESVRLGAARRELEGGASAKAAARASGFTTAEQLSRAFRRRLELSPTEYQRQHRRG